MDIQAEAISHIGLVRKKNEDSFLCLKSPGLFAVADGLGGLPFGDIASQTAISFLSQWARNAPLDQWINTDWESLIQEINEQVITEGDQTAENLGIGTTLSFLAMRGDTLQAGHIGDSRIYYWNTRKWIQASVDDTLATYTMEEQHLPEDTELPNYYYHTLTQCLGQRKLIKPHLFNLPLKKGYRYFICSDGVSGVLSDEYLEYAIKTHEKPAAFLEDILEKVMDAGAPDNATGVAIFV